MTHNSNRRSLAGSFLLCAAVLLALPSAWASQAQPAAQDPAADLLKQGQQLLRDGKLDDALATFRAAAAKAPVPSAAAANANIQAGIALDLMGKYSEARVPFAKAADVAAAPAEKARARRAAAMSYAFERNCAGIVKEAGPVFDEYLAAKDYANAGGVANELARACLESGDIDKAAAWYKRGYEAAIQAPELKPAEKDLWDFRWEHAQARLAARRNQPAEARKHADAAKAIHAKGANPEQAQFVPYLDGYVAFYAGDYQAALPELLKGNQNDPLVLCLAAQAYEKTGDQATAKEYYQKVMASPGHTPTNAWARPIAKEKLK